MIVCACGCRLLHVVIHEQGVHLNIDWCAEHQGGALPLADAYAMVAVLSLVAPQTSETLGFVELGKARIR